MAYKALYRKYRPNSFDDVVGQSAIVKILQNIVKTHRIGHAYLFNGPRGTGKTTIAKLFAKSVNCLNPINGLACNECEICKYIEKDNVTDIVEIDAASNNGVDEIRELKSKVNLVPSKCKYKVYIIDEVHMLSMGAFNALLKTLEEPPAHVIFILATTEVHKIPLTIISRCQNFNFKKIGSSQIMDRLKHIIEKEEIKIEENAIGEISSSTDGGMRDAIGLLEQLYTLTDDKITIDDVYKLNGSISNNDLSVLFSSILNNDADQLFDMIESFYNDGKDFVKITEQSVVFLKNILLCQKANKYFKQKNNNSIEAYEKLSSTVNSEQTSYFISEITAMLSDMQSSSYPKILFEIMVLKMLNNDNIKNNNEEKHKFKKEIGKIVDKEQKDESHSSTNEVKKEKSEKINDNNSEHEENKTNYKKVLINNAIALANKDNLKEIKEKWEQLNTFLINKDLKEIATILLDAKVVAASNDHAVLTYKYDAMVDNFDNFVIEIESLVAKMINRKYTLVAVEEEKWLELRQFYVDLKKDKKEIAILPETEVVLERNKKKEKSKKVSANLIEAIEVFGEDLIEMKG